MASAASGAIDRRDRQFGRQMAAPALSALLLVILFPIFFALYTSTFDYTLMHPVHDDFVGLEHYRERSPATSSSVTRSGSRCASSPRS